MSSTTARLTLVQGSILITLDGPEGTVADHSEATGTLIAALRAGILPVANANVTGWQDTILIQAECQDTGTFVPPWEGLAAALTAVLGTAGIEATRDDSFERAIRHNEHWERFLETAGEEVRAVLSEA